VGALNSFAGTPPPPWDAVVAFFKFPFRSVGRVRPAMPSSLKQSTAERCDRLFQECDRLVGAVDRFDFEIQALKNSAEYLFVQLALLGRAQADLDPQLRALSWRLFWSNLRPKALLDRLTRPRADSFLRIRRGTRPATVPVGQN
jgi:hypothetical protein